MLSELLEALTGEYPDDGFILISKTKAGGFAFSSNATHGYAIMDAFGSALQWVAEQESQPLIVAPGDLETN